MSDSDDDDGEEDKRDERDIPEAERSPEDLAELLGKIQWNCEAGTNMPM